MEINTIQEKIHKVINHFDEIVNKIRKKDFKGHKELDKKVCFEHDFRHIDGIKE